MSYESIVDGNIELTACVKLTISKYATYCVFIEGIHWVFNPNSVVAGVPKNVGLSSEKIMLRN